MNELTLTSGAADTNPETGLRANYYDTVANMVADTKLKSGQICVTQGYYEYNDGGSALYKITSGQPVGIDIIGLSNGLQAQIIITDCKIDARKFGMKPDAIFQSIDSKTEKRKYYSNSGKTVSATDNSSLFQSLLDKYGGKYDIYLIGSYCFNRAVELKSDGIQLYGTCSGLNLTGTNFVTNSNELECFLYFQMRSSDVPAQWHHSCIQKIHFNGGFNAKYGVKIKGFGENSIIRECYFDRFNEAGIYVYGTSTNTPIENCSFMFCKRGIEVRQLDGLSGTGSYFFSKISGDCNDALIHVHDDRTLSADVLGLGMYFEITGIKSEANNHILLIEKMSSSSAFLISGRLDEIDRTDKWTTSGSTPNAVTLRNCKYTPCVEANIWCHPVGRIINDESKSAIIKADSGLLFKPVKYGPVAK